MKLGYIVCLQIARNAWEIPEGKAGRGWGEGTPLFFLLALPPPLLPPPPPHTHTHKQKFSCCNHFCLSFLDQEKDARIIISLMYENKCRKLMCSVRKSFFSSLINFWFRYQCTLQLYSHEVSKEIPRKSYLSLPILLAGYLQPQFANRGSATFSSPVLSYSLSHQPPRPWRFKNLPARSLLDLEDTGDKNGMTHHKVEPDHSQVN